MYRAVPVHVKTSLIVNTGEHPYLLVGCLYVLHFDIQCSIFSLILVSEQVNYFQLVAEFVLRLQVSRTLRIIKVVQVPLDHHMYSSL